MLQLFHRELELLLDTAFVLGRENPIVRGPRGGARTDPDLDWRGVAGFVRHVARFAETSVPQSRHQVQRHQAARNLHDGQQDRHVSVEGDVHARQDGHAGTEGSRRVRTVITGDRRPVDSPQAGHVLQQEVGQASDCEVQGEAQDGEAGDVVDVGRLGLGEFFAPLPADGHQQVHGQALIDHVGELEPNLQDRDEETEIEEQQQRLEEIVGEVLPELIKHWCLRLIQSGDEVSSNYRGASANTISTLRTHGT